MSDREVCHSEAQRGICCLVREKRSATVIVRFVLIASFVSGHGFSRATEIQEDPGFSP